MTEVSVPILALSQGDPAGIGPEILLRLIERESKKRSSASWKGVFVLEGAAIEALAAVISVAGDVLVALDDLPERDWLLNRPERFFWVEPRGATRKHPVIPGDPGPCDARGALMALDTAVALVATGVADALVTAPLNKKNIAEEVLPGFLGHTDYLAQRAGLERYGRDYLMAFLSPRLRVALLSTHVPLRQALDLVTEQAVVEALELLSKHTSGTIALAGLNPHAGEGGLIGAEDGDILAPAVERARRLGVPVGGPVSPDTVFHRATKGGSGRAEFDWVLALYHDQGLIAVKSLAFGEATNWTVGLPYLRTSVDHGTAYDIAGRGEADIGSLVSVVDRTLELIESR